MGVNFVLRVLLERPAWRRRLRLKCITISRQRVAGRDQESARKSLRKRAAAPP